MENNTPTYKGQITYDQATHSGVPEFNIQNSLSEIALSNNMPAEAVDVIRRMSEEELRANIDPNVIKEAEDLLAERRTKAINQNLEQVPASEGGMKITNLNDVGSAAVGAFQNFQSTVGDELNNVITGIGHGAANAVGETVELVNNVFGGKMNYDPVKTYSATGDVAEAISRFAYGWLGLGKLKSASGAGKVIQAGVNALKGVAVDFSITDRNDQNLANLAKDLGVHNAFTDFMASKPGQSEVDAGFKAALEGAGIGVAGDALVMAAKTLRAAKALKTAGHAKLADELVMATDISKAKTSSTDEALDTLFPASVGKKNSSKKTTKEIVASLPPLIDEVESAITPNGVDTVKVQKALKPYKPVDGMKVAKKTLKEKGATVDSTIKAVEDAKAKVLSKETSAKVQELLSSSKSTTPLPEEAVDEMISNLAPAYKAGELTPEGIKQEVGAYLKANPTKKSFEELVHDAMYEAGVLSQDEVDSALNFIGLTADKANDTVQDVITSTMLLKLQRKELESSLELAAKYPSERAETDFTKSLTKLLNMEVKFSEMGTGQGQAFQARKQVSNGVIPDFADYKPLSSPKKILGDITDPKTGKIDIEKAKAVASAKVLGKPTSEISKKLNGGLDLLQEYNVNSLVSGLSTIVSNFSSIIPTIATPVSKVIGGAVTRNNLAFREGTDTLTYLLGQAKIASEMTKQFGAEGYVSAFKRAFTGAADPSLLTHTSSQFDSDLTTKTGILRWVLNTPTKLLSATDEVFQRANYNANVYAQAMGMAEKTAQRGTQEFEDALNKYLQLAYDESGVATSTFGRKYAQDQTLATPLQGTDSKSALYNMNSSIAKTIMSESSNANPLAKIAMIAQPFYKVPLNIAEGMIELDPILSHLSKPYRDKIYSGDPEQVGKLVIGGSIYGAVGVAVANGSITGGGSLHGESDTANRALGWQPYSFVATNKDGSKTYTSYKQYGQYALVLGNAANLFETALGADFEHFKTQNNEDLFTKLAASGMENVLSINSLQGATSLLQAVSDFSAGKGFRAFNKLNKNISGRVVPKIVSDTTTYAPPGDALKQDVQPGLQQISAAIGIPTSPGVKADLKSIPKKYDQLGHPILAPSWVLKQTTAVQGNAVRNEFKKLADMGSPIMPMVTTVNGIDHHNFVSKEGKSLLDVKNELLRTLTIGGQTMEKALYDAVQSPQYAERTYPDRVVLSGDPTEVSGGKAKMLKSIVSKFYNAVNNQLKDPNYGFIDARTGQTLLDANREAERGDIPPDSESQQLDPFREALSNFTDGLPTQEP